MEPAMLLYVLYELEVWLYKGLFELFTINKTKYKIQALFGSGCAYGRI